MKKVFNLLILALGLNAFFACGGDDEDSVSVISVPTELRPFVGNYTITSNNPTNTFPDYSVFFFQDRQCYVKKMNGNSYDWHIEGMHTWNYDATSKILSIAGLADAQWLVTSQFEDTWSGLSLWASTQQGYVAKRNSIDYRFYFDHVNEWKCDTVKAIVSNDHYLTLNVTWMQSHDGMTKAEDIVINFDNYTSKDGWVTTEISEVPDKDMIVFDKTYWHGDYTSSNRRPDENAHIEFVHPYSFSNLYINLTVSKDGKEVYSGKFLPVEWR